MRRHSPSVVAVAAVGGLYAATVTARCHQRGLPYAPQGTVMDFTSSPRHMGLADLQSELDRRTGRQTNGVYEGATFVPGQGAQPARSMPFFTGTFNRREEERRRSFQQLKPWEQEYIKQRLPQKERRSAYDVIKPELGDNYQADIRTDPEFAELPEHVRAAKQSILTYQSDSYGEAPRGVVPPPPPIDPLNAPQAYIPRRVEITDTWYILMIGFVLMFLVLAMCGN